MRRILAHSPSLMLVENVAPAGVLPVHQYPHEQLIYVQSGEVRLVCEGQEQVMHAGDSCAIPSGVPHGLVATADVVILDIFHPARED